jgi:hypothetical protein
MTLGGYAQADLKIAIWIEFYAGVAQSIILGFDEAI